MGNTKKELAELDGTVRTTSTGYASGIRCEKVHGGNRGIARQVVGAWQCQGCGASYHVETVLAMQSDAQPGRPPTDRGRGSPQVGVRLSPSEHDRLERDAAKRGISPAEVLRRSYFGG
jgi:hypothetical protein